MQRPRTYRKRYVVPRRPRGSAGRWSKTSATTLVIVVIICVNIFLTGFLVFRGLRKKPIASVRQEPVQSVVVAVMNGCGVPGVAQQVSDYLKANQFVARHENWQNFEVQRTVVLDRVSAKKEKARQVASALGLGNEDVLAQLDPSAGCDVTVVLGRDYLRLTPFRR